MAKLRHVLMGVISSLALSVGVTRSASGQDLRFVDSAATGSGLGTSWSNAFPDLWTALEAIAEDEQLGNVDIWVAEGEYRPQIASGVGGAFILRAGVRLYGGFEGGAANETELVQRKPADNITILDGQIEYACDDPFPACGAPGAGDCDTAHPGLGCEDEDC